MVIIQRNYIGSGVIEAQGDYAFGYSWLMCPIGTWRLESLSQRLTL